MILGFIRAVWRMDNNLTWVSQAVGRVCVQAFSSRRISSFQLVPIL